MAVPAGGAPRPSPCAYVHIPFCASRCDYCAFATWTGREALVEDYVAALRTEIRSARRAGELAAPSTVFIGGGTPSLIGGTHLAAILEACAPAPGAEVTVECNPESTTRELLVRLRDAGVTRISLGVQSLVPHVLAGLGRAHSPDSARRAVALAGEVGFESLNVDLIYGGAGERDEDWAATLTGVLALEPRPSHISAYALSVEPGTPLARDPARHPDDDVQAERYLACDARLAHAGYRWYEVSNWALEGHECRHNQGYWTGAPYLGFGCSAHSFLGGERYANVVSLDRYLSRVRAGLPTRARTERLAGAARALEALQLALRTRDGVPDAALAPDDALDGLVERRDGRCVLSARGRLLASEIALRLVVPA